jgi:outer membrane protein assembly factor BamE (lipoprotein component of BamABCDE complex)
MTYKTIMRQLVLLFTIAVALCLSGCVGLVASNADYSEISVGLRNKAETQAAFGTPLRRETKDDSEIWYYNLETVDGMTEWAVTRTGWQVFLLLIPVWYTSNYSENTKFIFHQEKLSSAFELSESINGFLCGLVFVHGVHPICGTQGKAGSEVNSNKKPDTTSSQCGCHGKQYLLSELPEICAAPPANWKLSAEAAACYARNFLQLHTLAESVYAVTVEGGGYFYRVTTVPTENDTGSSLVLRVNIRSGVVASKSFKSLQQ